LQGEKRRVPRRVSIVQLARFNELEQKGAIVGFNLLGKHKKKKKKSKELTVSPEKVTAKAESRLRTDFRTGKVGKKKHSGEGRGGGESQTERIFSILIKIKLYR